MDTPNNRPWQRDYTIKQTLVLAETPGLRVIDQTLAPGERVPWHLHPDNDDLFICLRGTFEIHEINPERRTVLKALERHLVPKREPHMVVNASSEDCQLLTVQGPGQYDFRRLPKLDGK
ncbi:MAG TPA: cupin domain-containing protein [Burkholderiales bacterium]|nr:cupin domain-containing protein [Burkholderiales bacterium]